MTGPGRLVATDRWRETAEAFADPRVGDVFQEFYTYWVEVVELTEDGQVVVETTASETPVRFSTRDAYRNHFEYTTRPGEYFVLLHERGAGPAEKSTYDV